MAIIGQNKLKLVLDNYTIQTLPKTLMFIGEMGCGKRTFAEYLAKKFNFEVVQIDEKVTQNDLDVFLLRTIDTLYIIDLNKFSEKQQNQFLKFIEEPSKSVYILLLTNSEVGVLNTILNRCTKYNFEPYTLNEVEQIINSRVNEQAFKIFKTPGKLLNLTESSFKRTLDLASDLLYKSKNMTYAAVLTISTKINYKDLYDKIDFTLFLDAVEYLALENFKSNNSLQSLIVFNITNKFKQYFNQQSLLKETLMLNYLTALWEGIHSGISGT